MRKTLATLTWLLIAFGATVFAKGWNGIVPCVSTRLDAEKIVGKDTHPNITIGFYRYKNSRVVIDYFRKDGQNPDKDIVQTIDVYPNENLLLSAYVKKIKNFPIGFEKWKMDPKITHIRYVAYYANVAENFQIGVQGSEDKEIIFVFQYYGLVSDCPKLQTSSALAGSAYNPIWFAPINDPKKPDWEILPQEAKPGEVILSKRNELGILSNFAATPFELDGKRYASVEGFWQMMLYPETDPCPDCPIDPRLKEGVEWKYTREQVAQMTGFEAKAAGTLAEENMKKLGIDWCSYQGKKFLYRSATPGEHYRLIVAAMRAKLNQNPEVKRILLATGDLTLKPDHYGEENPPPEWKYYEIWMQIRRELAADKRR